MATKNRILLLKEYLEENTDDDRKVTKAQIIEYLMGQDCKVTDQTVRADIRTLQDCGYNIVQVEADGMPTKYFWADRTWQNSEIQILYDAVSSAQFISKKKCMELTGKLVREASPSYRKQLQSQIIVSERIKAPNEDILYILNEIGKAIDKNQMISFRYYQYNPKKERVLKRDEKGLTKLYKVSPYATIWNNDRYYLICRIPGKFDCSRFRIDRMETPEILEKEREPQPADLNLQDYTDKVFWMYKGKMETVTLRCMPEIMDQVIDKFGESVNVTNVADNGVFDIAVEVSVSLTFFAWVFQFTGQMNIIQPENVIRKYAEYLEQALDNALAAP